MDLYAKIKELDERVQAGETTLLEVLDELRVMRADRLSRTQIEAATRPVSVTGTIGQTGVTPDAIPTTKRRR